MNLATPAPKVETASAEPADRLAEVTVTPTSAVEEATVEPAKAVAPAETVDDPRKFAPANALNGLPAKSKMSVDGLRAQGIDFESRVAVVKGGAPKKSWLKLKCPLLFDQRDYFTFSEIARYAVIQSNSCFIFLESTDLEPMYAFSLGEVTAEVEDRDKPDLYSCTINPCNETNKMGKGLETVLLRYKKTGKIAHQFTFETAKDASVVKRFLDVVARAGEMSEATVTSTSKTEARGGGKK